MKVNGIKIKGTVEATKDLWMVTFIKADMLTEKQTEKELLVGLMEKLMMVNGWMGLKTVMVYGKEKAGILILDNGKIAKQMDMEYMYGQLVIDMKANGKLA